MSQDYPSYINISYLLSKNRRELTWEVILLSMHYVSFVLMGGAFRNSRFLMQNTWQTIGKMKCVKISLPYFYLTFHHAYRVLPKRRDKDDSYCWRIDQSTSPFIYSDNESATILGKCQMNRVYARISCPTWLVFTTAIWFSNVKKMRTRSWWRNFFDG